VPELLRGAGVKVQAAAPAEHERNDKVKARRLLGWSGLVFASNGERDSAVVKNVIPDSPAWRAGITFGDEIIAVDGARTKRRHRRQTPSRRQSSDKKSQSPSSARIACARPSCGWCAIRSGSGSSRWMRRRRRG
jgi:predicted metalloprotease with PDZ domain